MFNKITSALAYILACIEKAQQAKANQIIKAYGLHNHAS